MSIPESVDEIQKPKSNHGVNEYPEAPFGYANTVAPLAFAVPDYAAFQIAAEPHIGT